MKDTNAGTFGKAGRELVDNIFEKGFYSNNIRDPENNNIYITLDKTDDLTKLKNEYNNSENYAEALVIACNELNSYLGLNKSIIINIPEEISNRTAYLEKVIEYFISYTTQLHDFSNITEYNSKSEMVDLYEDVKMTVKTINVDYFFFDDKLEITKKPNTTT